jgi:hypothetical protein
MNRKPFSTIIIRSSGPGVTGERERTGSSVAFRPKIQFTRPFPISCLWESIKDDLNFLWKCCITSRFSNLWSASIPRTSSMSNFLDYPSALALLFTIGTTLM